MILKKTDFSRNDFNQKLPTKKEKPNRLVVFILFLGTTALSFFLWLQPKLSQWRNQLFQPTTYQIIKPVGESLEEFIGFKPDLKDLAGLKNSINLSLTDLQGTYGIYFYELDKQVNLGINDDQVYIAASVNKLPIMVSFYQQVEKSKLREEDEYILEAADVQDYGSGQMRYQPWGTKYQYRELIELAGKLSDNTAAYVLENLVGKKTIQSSLNKLGMVNTSLDDNTTTVKEMGDYLVKLYQNKLISAKNKEKIFTALTKTDFEDRITKGVPENIRVVHKIGNEIQAYNDCGIIFGPKPYILCVLTKEVAEAEALAVIPKISRLVWEYVEK